MKLRHHIILLCLVFCQAAPVSAQAQTAQSAHSQAPQITFDSFTAVYHLSRDSHGLSLLTTEETIVADFPASSYYGITRSLPTKFQNHSVDIKILSVVDAAGNSLTYKKSFDGHDNLIITTGDPAITLYGSQTIKLSYQTKGVISLGQKSDDFLLNVNGRGWSQPIGQVNAALYVPASFRARLRGQPSCYTSPPSQTAAACQINTKKNADATLITAKATPVAARQALVMKLSFEPATFTNKPSPAGKYLAITTLAVGLLVAYRLLRKK